MRFLFIMILVAGPVYAGPIIIECGNYQINGVVRKDSKDILRVVVYEGTKSEISIVTDLQLHKIAGFINMPISMQANVSKIDGTRLWAKNISSVKFNSKLMNDKIFQISQGQCE